MQDNDRLPLYLFAKAPVAGQVKTRMQPTLDAESCAELAQYMLEQTLEKAAAVWPGRCVLCVSPDTSHPLFKRLSARYGCELKSQTGGGLGERMTEALNHGIEQSGAAVVMGCDVPHFTPSILSELWHLLVAGEDVIGPAEDGGFYLLGTQSDSSEIFRNVVWGGVDVRARVVSQAARHGQQFHFLPLLRDIDSVEDLRWLAGQEPEYQRFLVSRDQSKQIAHGL